MLGRSDLHAWNWQVWEVAKDSTRKWVGFFESEKDALQWKRGTKGDYVINNVPPQREAKVTVKRPIIDRGGSWDTIPAAPVRRVKPKAAKPLTAAEQRLVDEARALHAKHEADEIEEFGVDQQP